jgi:hypothetical protein
MIHGFCCYLFVLCAVLIFLLYSNRVNVPEIRQLTVVIHHFEIAVKYT